jgi:hypothetical protein
MKMKMKMLATVEKTKPEKRSIRDLLELGDVKLMTV